MEGSKILITGANGQLGRALAKIYPKAIKADSAELDITSPEALRNFDWSSVEIIINASAYTDVDGAETPEGEKLAWAVNDRAVGNLVDIANRNNLLLIHIATDYDFDGTKNGSYKEDDPVNPLGKYAKSKTEGSKKASQAAKKYIIRTAWVIGDGKNFVRTMLDLGKRGVAPTVVADQIGRPTFTTELAKGIKFLIDNKPPYGIYNITNEGDPVSWADLTREIFKQAGYDLKVINTATKEYFASKPGVAPRPLNSVLDLAKIEATGFTPRDWREDLREYIKKEISR